MVVAASAAGVWRAAYPPVEPLLAPGALAVHVVDAGLGRREVSYQLAGTPNDWRAAVGQQLVEHGWTPLDLDFRAAPSTLYLRTIPFGLGSVLERAELAGGPREAHITVIRRFYWKWSWLLPLFFPATARARCGRCNHAPKKVGSIAPSRVAARVVPLFVPPIVAPVGTDDTPSDGVLPPVISD
jgi:hypothetical protein